MKILQKMRLSEALSLDLEVGDLVLTGKFKNKKVVIKSFGEDENGQPIFNNDKKLLAVRIAKKMPKKKEKDNAE